MIIHSSTHSFITWVIMHLSPCCRVKKALGGRPPPTGIRLGNLRRKSLCGRRDPSIPDMYPVRVRNFKKWNVVCPQGHTIFYFKSKPTPFQRKTRPRPPPSSSFKQMSFWPDNEPTFHFFFIISLTLVAQVIYYLDLDHFLSIGSRWTIFWLHITST